MAEQDEVAPVEDLERWVLIGHSPHQHYRTNVGLVHRGQEYKDVNMAACGYCYTNSFEIIPEGDPPLPRCPRCLAAIATTAGPSMVRG